MGMHKLVLELRVVGICMRYCLPAFFNFNAINIITMGSKEIALELKVSRVIDSLPPYLLNLT